MPSCPHPCFPKLRILLFERKLNHYCYKTTNIIYDATPITRKPIWKRNFPGFLL